MEHPLLLPGAENYKDLFIWGRWDIFADAVRLYEVSLLSTRLLQQ